MKKIDRITGLILIFVAGFAYYRSFSFPKLGVTETGPAFFPRLVTMFIIGLSILLILMSFKKGKDEENVEIKELKRVLLTIGIMVFYLVGFLYIGFFVARFLSLIFIMYVMGIRKKTTIILVSLVSTGIVYLVFYYVFKVPLPEGILI